MSNLEDAVRRVLFEWPGIPATEEQINAVEARLGRPLPTAFREVLKVSDGVPTAGEVVLYGTASLFERNEDWAHVSERAPGFLAIGDDSGGRVLLMRSDPQATAVELCDIVVLDEPSAFVHVAEHLHDWVESGLELPSD